MHARTTLLCLASIGIGCGGEGRDQQAISGSAGFSAGGASDTSVPMGSTSGDVASTSGASGTTGGDGPSGTTGPSAEMTASATASTGGGESSEATSNGTSTSGRGDSSSGGESDSSGIVDGVLEIGIIAHNDCTFTVEPSSIAIAKDEEFTVNWVSSPASEVEFDIAKIDAFNQVPIVIDMTPGYSYHDEVRVWCSFPGTEPFNFRLTSCHDPVYIPVDCGL